MFTSRLATGRWALVWCFFFFSSLLNHVQAADMTYCSSINTASTPKNSSIYQSNGLCSGFCVDDYAFAVLQYDGCWCSDYAPATESDGCDKACPGYGFESCGGVGVYGYIQLKKKVAGTQSAAQGSPSTKQDTPTVVKTSQLVTPTIVTIPPTSSTTSETSTSSSSTSTKAAITTTDKSGSSSTWTPTPIISLETVTGQVRTVTVTPTQGPDSQSANRLPQSSHKGGLSTGAAVGLTVGLVALVAIVCSIIYFCLKKRRQQREQEEEYVDTSKDSMQGLGGPIPSRSMSENSRYVLGTDGRQVVETWEPHEDRDAPGSRKSRLMPVDPRLDPFAVYQRNGPNKSHESINTLRDDHDYSRRVHQDAPKILRATNPD